MIIDSLQAKNNQQVPTAQDYETLQLMANSISSHNEFSSQNSTDVRPLKMMSKINSPSRHKKLVSPLKQQQKNNSEVQGTAVIS